jgi:Outer membrane protein beta-barrel domain
MKKLSVLAMTLLMTVSLFAQKEETIFGKSGLRISGAWGGTSSNISQIADDYAVFNGGFGGIEFNRAVFIGWGGYKLNSDVQVGEMPTSPNLEMNYNGLMLGYTLQPHKPIHATFMVMGGKGDLQVNDSAEDNIIVVKPSAGLELNVFRWFHIGLRGGYRMVLDSDLPEVNDTDLSGIFAEANLKFGISWDRSGNRREQEKKKENPDSSWP